MKKLLTLLLSVILAVGCCLGLTACGEPEPEFKVGLICLHGESSTYDKNFIEAFRAACKEQNVEPIIVTDVDEKNVCYDKAKDLVSQGCKVIFADSFGHEEFIIKAAKEFKDVQFCHATGTKAHTEGLDNYHNAFANIYEGRFLAGVAAGLKLQEMIASKPETAQKVGYVGAYPYAEVVSGYTAWYLGVKSIIADVTMEVQYTYSWYSEESEKNAANTLIGNGCVLLSQHADSMGAPTACEDKNVPNVSYNGSTASSCPNTFIISSRINWQPYYEYVIKAVKNNAEIKKDYMEGLGEDFSKGSVCLTELGTAAAEGTQAKLDEVAKKLKDGTLKVFDTSTFTVKGNAVTSYRADVDDAGDFVGETEVIKKSGEITYFAESEFRSAPYFDLRIDGITELNPTQN